MAKTIVLLEDDARRVSMMTTWLGDRFPGYVVRVWANSTELCSALEDIWQDVVLMLLDHDLAIEPDREGRLVDQGSGQEVAEYLAAREPAFPVVFHSTNSAAVERMDRLLLERGWQTAVVTPYGDLEWVSEKWWPVVRNLLVHAPGRDLRQEPAGVFPFRVAEMLQGLIRAQREEHPIQLDEDQERLLRRWVRYVVVKIPRLTAYINWLRAEVGKFPSLNVLPREVAHAVVSGGPEALTVPQLVRLALDPVALFHLHDRVREEKPAVFRRQRIRARSRPPEGVAAAFPTRLLLRVGEARLGSAAANSQEPSDQETVSSPASDQADAGPHYHNEVWLTYAGRTYQGTLGWDRQQGPIGDAWYVLLELKGLRDSPLASYLTTPTLIVRSVPSKGGEGGKPPWREEVPLTWNPRNGVLISAWYPVPLQPTDLIELEFSLAPSNSARSAGRIHEADTHQDDYRGTFRGSAAAGPETAWPDRLSHHW